METEVIQDISPNIFLFSHKIFFNFTQSYIRIWRAVIKPTNDFPAIDPWRGSSSWYIESFVHGKKKSPSIYWKYTETNFYIHLFNRLQQFGQFLTHDVTHSASITTSVYFDKFEQSFCVPRIRHVFFLWIVDDGASIRCCSKDGASSLPQSALHFACFPILIEPDDEFYRQFDQGCINMVRSSLAPDGDCQLGYGKQVKNFKNFSIFSKSNLSLFIPVEQSNTFRGCISNIWSRYSHANRSSQFSRRTPSNVRWFRSWFIATNNR